jgi:single-stranded-DNA-specific exonuclease
MEPVQKKHWQLAQRISPEVDNQLKEFSPAFRQILFNRGCFDSQQANNFLNGQVAGTTDPYALKDMDFAIGRILKAIESHERIAIYGDYDVDGVTATVLLVEVLRLHHASVMEYIPHRYDEGYGLNNDALESLFKQEVRLVITVDCGIRSLPEARFAHSIGLDMIISDHHQPGDELPVAVAVINPRQTGDTYPDKELTGVGLAYKIAQALEFCHLIDNFEAENWLDLVALGTVADLASLTGENRMLVAAGLERISTQERQGVFSLRQVAGIGDRQVTANDIGFILGPRLNAAGRMDSAMAAFELLETRDHMRAGELAQLLDKSNYERQLTTREIQAKAAEKAQASQPDQQIIFASDPDFKEGIVGLAASRLVEIYYRPAIVAHQGEKCTRGSCRSIPEFHITWALDQCADLLVRYGGHKAAAGFTVENQNLQALIDRLEKIAEKELSNRDLQPVLNIESELRFGHLHAEDITRLLKEIDRLQPTGIGNPEPLFCSRNMLVKRAQPVGRDKNHLKLALVDERGIFHNGIAFRQGYWAENMPDRVDLVYSLEINEYAGQQTIQLNIKDIQPVAG